MGLLSYVPWSIHLLLIIMMKLLYIVLCVFVTCILCDEDMTEDEDDDYIYYKDYHTVVIQPLEPSDKLELLIGLRDKYERLPEGVKNAQKPMIFFEDILRPGRKQFVVIGPTIQEEVYAFLDDNEIEYSRGQENLQKIFDWNWDRNNYQKTRYKDTLAQDIYMAPFYFMMYNEMSEFLKYIAMDINERLGPVASTFSLGKSSEGEEIMGFVFNEKRTDLPGIWIDGGLDPRNYLAPAMGIFLLWELFNKNEDESVFMRENFRWYIVPNVNPDGFKYNFDVDRMWPKSTSGMVEGGSDRCFGVNLMKNFDVNFGGPGSSADPCSDLYKGPEPRSEPETKALADALLARKDVIQLYINLGSFGHSWNIPWSGLELKKPENYDYQYYLGKIGVDKIADIASTAPSLGTHPDLSYVRSGHVLDYVNRELGIPYSYSIDLRPVIDEIPMEANYFDLPPTFIHLSGPEIFSALVKMGEELLKGVVLPAEGVKFDKQEL